MTSKGRSVDAGPPSVNAPILSEKLQSDESLLSDDAAVTVTKRAPCVPSFIQSDILTTPVASLSRPAPTVAVIRKRYAVCLTRRGHQAVRIVAETKHRFLVERIQFRHDTIDYFKLIWYPKVLAIPLRITKPWKDIKRRVLENPRCPWMVVGRIRAVDNTRYTNLTDQRILVAQVQDPSVLNARIERFERSDRTIGYGKAALNWREKPLPRHLDSGKAGDYDPLIALTVAGEKQSFEYTETDDADIQSVKLDSTRLAEPTAILQPQRVTSLTNSRNFKIDTLAGNGIDAKINATLQSGQDGDQPHPSKGLPPALPVVQEGLLEQGYAISNKQQKAYRIIAETRSRYIVQQRPLGRDCAEHVEARWRLKSVAGMTLLRQTRRTWDDMKTAAKQAHNTRVFAVSRVVQQDSEPGDVLLHDAAGPVNLVEHTLSSTAADDGEKTMMTNTVRPPDGSDRSEQRKNGIVYPKPDWTHGEEQITKDDGMASLGPPTPEILQTLRKSSNPKAKVPTPQQARAAEDVSGLSSSISDVGLETTPQPSIPKRVAPDDSKGQHHDRKRDAESEHKRSHGQESGSRKRSRMERELDGFNRPAESGNSMWEPIAPKRQTRARLSGRG